MRFNKETVATFAILLVTLFWGMTFVLIKEAVAELSPFNFIFWRFGIASLLLAIIFAKNLKQINKKLIIHGAVLGLLLGGTVIFQTIGLQFTKASNASFITGFAVVLVTIFASLLNRKLPKVNSIVATLLSIVGLAFITLAQGFHVNIGDFWVMLCSICIAWHIIFTGKYTHEHESLSLTIVQMLTITVMSGVIAFGTSGIAIPQTYKVWQAILFCSIFASAIAFSLQIHFQKYLSSAKTAVVFTAEPIFATVTAIIYLGEAITVHFVVGALCILSAMLLAELGRKSKAV